MEDRISPLMEQEKEALRPGLTSLSVLKSLLIRLHMSYVTFESTDFSVSVFLSLISRFVYVL